MKRLLLSVLCICVTATVFPRWWCGREAGGWLAGELAVQRELADVVAASSLRGVRPGDIRTGSAHFDGEWALVTNQMTVLGLGQLILAHPAEKARYLPAMRSAVAHALAEDARAFGTEAWGEDGLSPGALARDNGHVYLGYLAMALGMLRSVDDQMPADQLALHDALISALKRRLSKAPHALIETFPGVTFPADVASAIGAIGLHARATGADHGELLRSWSAEFRRSCVDPKTGFVFQTVSPTTGKATGAPRGSGTALVIYFVSFADMALARELDAAVAKAGMRSLLGFGGVAEYPRGVHAGQGDIDSGPVVLGVSVSASGFGMAGPKMFADADRFRALFRTAYLFGAPAPKRDGRGYLVGSGLGDAILLAMMTARTGT